MVCTELSLLLSYQNGYYQFVITKLSILLSYQIVITKKVVTKMVVAKSQLPIIRPSIYQQTRFLHYCTWLFGQFGFPKKKKAKKISCFSYHQKMIKLINYFNSTFAIWIFSCLCEHCHLVYYCSQVTWSPCLLLLPGSTVTLSTSTPR